MTIDLNTLSNQINSDEISVDANLTSTLTERILARNELSNDTEARLSAADSMAALVAELRGLGLSVDHAAEGDDEGWVIDANRAEWFRTLAADETGTAWVTVNLLTGAVHVEDDTRLVHVLT